MVDPVQYTLFDDENKNNVLSLVHEFAKELKNISGKCMDIGSGAGDITKEILIPALDPNATMIGVDIMEKMVEYANKTYGDNKRLKFEVLDIQTKNLPEKYISKFDHVFSFHALQWCHDIRQTFENIYRLLRPDKTMLILSVVRHKPFFESLKVMVHDLRYASYIKDKKKYVGLFYDSIHPDAELKKILENIGFQVHHCSHREIKHYLNSKKLIARVTTQDHFAFFDEMPYNLREEFKNEFARIFEEIKIEEYRKKQTNDKLQNDKKETDIPFYYTMLVVYAQKKVS